MSTLLHVGNSELISTVNNRLVLEAVRVMGPTYRAEVARRTRLNPATVTGIVNELLSNNMLVEVREKGDEPVSNRNGRPPTMLSVNADAGRILAIDLEPDRIRVGLFNLMLETLEYRERLIDRMSEAGLICDQIIELGREAIRGMTQHSLNGIGVSLPGLIDYENGLLVSSTNMPKIKHVPISALLEKEFGAPVPIERSLHLASLYDHWLDQDRTQNNTLVITLRTGIGMSLMRNGELYLGRNRSDGEIGHTVVDIDGKPCECGSRGCLETFVSATAICDRVVNMIQQGGCKAVTREMEQGSPLRPELIYRLAKEGDRDCSVIVKDVGRYIGIAVSNMINVFAPDEVVICGSIDTADDLILEAVKKQIEQTALPSLRESVVVRLALAKEKSPLMGAAVLVAQQLFELPKLSHA